MPPRPKKNKYKNKAKKVPYHKNHRYVKTEKKVKTPEEKLDDFIKSESGVDDNQVPYESYYQMWLDNFVKTRGPEDDPNNIIREELNDQADNNNIINHEDTESSNLNENNVDTEPLNENNGEDNENDDNETLNEDNEKNDNHLLDNSKWYGKSIAYWEKVDATVNGMLGGFESISDVDIKGSKTFLNRFRNGKQFPQNPIAIDVGAGIGRIAKHLLTPICGSVDLLEQNSKFLQKAKENLILSNTEKIGEFFCSSIQDFEFTRKYDIIWIQWVIIYLTDEDFIGFFRKCKNALTEQGIIFLKDNVLQKGFCLDTADSSVTRSDRHLKLLFEISGLKIIKEETQNDFPSGLFPVKTFALN